MRRSKVRYSLTLSVILILLTTACAGGDRDTTPLEQAPVADEQFLLTYPNLATPHGEILLDNELVVVQRFVLAPGEWEGIHSHPGNQFYVHIKGGEWSERRGGEQFPPSPFSPDGSGGWMDPIPLSEGHESGNTGDTPIDLIWVTLKKDEPVAPDVEHVPQIYPNIPLELVLENDRVIVQRVQLEPGEWEGVHSHPSNQVYIHIKGGVWSERRGSEQLPPSPFSPDGSVGWSNAVDLSAGHQSGNTGDTTIDLMWITLK